MTETYLNLKDIALKNNCPECFNNEGLLLSFKQKTKENKFTKSITNIVDHQIICQVCNTNIYPERWTEDIERVYEYHKKTIQPRNSSVKLKPLAWIVFFLIDAIIIVFVFFFLNR